MIGLVSVRALSQTLGVPVEQLKRVAAEVDTHYHEWTHTDRRTGKVRTIKSPDDELKWIQSRIAKRLFAFQYGEEVQGSVRKRSPKTNAEKHLGKPCVVTIDVQKFFPSVKPTVVYQLLRYELGYGCDVAKLITRLVTKDRELPQGAPTSVAIANALLRLPVDGPVQARAASIGCGYTRFVDDLALSGRNPKVIINFIARQLSRRQLTISRKDKLKIMPSSGPQEITGLLVNGKRPSLSKKRRDRVRAAIHQLRGVAASAQRNKAINSMRGRINHVRQFNPGTAKRLEKQLESIKS